MDDHNVSIAMTIAVNALLLGTVAGVLLQLRQCYALIAQLTRRISGQHPSPSHCPHCGEQLGHDDCQAADPPGPPA